MGAGLTADQRLSFANGHQQPGPVHEKSKESKSAGNAGGLAFAGIFLLISVLLLFQLTAETRFSTGKALVSQPRFWPAVGVIGMAFFGLSHVISIWRQRQHRSTTRTVPHALREIMTWLRAVEYLGWFMIYVAAVPVVGYLSATLLMTSLLAVRTGYRSLSAILVALGMGLGIVLVFKTFLAVRIPGGAVYEYLPAALRNFMIVNF